ncbi:MAG: hypothetical protein KGH95_07300, partial [Thaumarchaeota archaeon]|nr:hypothetical protein [Nitrososphaerota archaeon]
NIVSFNTVMPVGARLAGLKLDASLGEAVNDTGKYAEANADKLTQIVSFTSSYDDNLKQILGPKYDPMLVSENINNIKSLPQKLILPKPTPPPVPVVNATTHTTPPATLVKNTTKVSISATISVSTNSTKSSISLLNKTSTNETKSSLPVNGTKIIITANVVVSHTNGTVSNTTKTKTVSLSEKLAVNSTTK